MPSLGADMDEGTLLEWLVQPGDPVHKGDVVAVVDTSKAAIEVECFEEGVVDALLVEPGTRVPVGTPLARIGGGAVSGPVDSRPVAARPVESRPVESRPVESRPVESRPDVSPLVRRLAAESGVDVESLHGTGRGGRVTRADVRAAAAATAQPPAAEPAVTADPAVTAEPAPRPRSRLSPDARRLAAELGVDPAAVRPAAGADSPVRAADVRAAAAHATAAARPSRPSRPSRPAGRPRRAVAAAGDRQTIARLMSRSKREIPHYYLTQSVDLDAALTWMAERNRSLPVTRRLLPAALLLRATALAVAEAPALNGFWVDDDFVPGSGVHLGVAVSLRGGGLVAPAIHDADALGVEDLMAALKDLAVRARAGSLRGSELADPTITVTNLGEQGVESVHGVIHPPQVALVGFGAVRPRPWAVDGMLGVRPVVVATLAADHRATDGFTGARLLARIDRLLQTPEAL